jgi:hypothetical protein
LISDALYKSGNSEVEHPGAIIKSMASKNSVRLKVGVSRGQEWTSEERELVNTLWG